MPYPSPATYPSSFLFPGIGDAVAFGDPVAIGSLVLNTTDELGVDWVLSEFEGWDSPASTLELTQRARGHGATGTEPFYRPRVMTLSGVITAPSVEAGRVARDTLANAVSLEPFTLLVGEAGLIRHCSAQRQDQVLMTRIEKSDTRFSLQIAATDPRKFGDLITASTSLPASSGGLVYPVTYPVTYTGAANTGVISVNNTGNTSAPVWLRIDGPIPAGGWTVTHVGKKQALTFSTSLALAAGEFVTVDMDRREVLAQGQSARSGYVTSRGWFSLDPGVNEIAFSATNYSSTALLTVATKPAWS